jgi:hypothetical protein
MEKRGYWRLKKKNYITLCGKLALDEAKDLS